MPSSNLRAPLSAVHSKRRATLGLLLAALWYSACHRDTPGDASAQPKPSAEPASSEAPLVRIGYQKYGVLIVVKAKGTLDEALGKSGVRVEWSEFPAGIQMMEALQAGRLDFGVVGEAPPVFAQAAGAPLVYVATEPASPRAEAILVREGSPLRTVADLKGKTIAVNKGSNSHYLILRALEEAHVPYADVKVQFIPPADARVAFETGRVDAWAIWDYFFAVAQNSGGTRVLRDGQGLVANPACYVGTRDFVQKNPRTLRSILDSIGKIDQWVTSNRRGRWVLCHAARSRQGSA